MRAPTMGFGLVVPLPRSASSSARFMYSKSERMNPFLPFLFEEGVDVLVDRERDEIVDRFANADVSNRQLQLAGNGNGDAALGGSVQLGQHDTVHTGGVHELARLNQTVLSHGRVEHEQHVVRRPGDLARGDTPNLVE